MHDCVNKLEELPSLNAHKVRIGPVRPDILMSEIFAMFNVRVTQDLRDCAQSLARTHANTKKRVSPVCMREDADR